MAKLMHHGWLSFKAWHIPLLLLLFLNVSCKSPKPFYNPNTSGFKKSTQPKGALVDSLNQHNSFDRSLCYRGKARLNVQTKESNDSGIADFQVCEDAAFFKMKNRLGIEALRVWQKQDSLFIWDLIAKKAFRMRKNELADPRLNALATIDLFSVLKPHFEPDEMVVYENEQQFMIVNNNQKSFLVDKKSFFLQQIIQAPDYAQFDRIGLSKYAQKDSLFFPTRIELLNSQTETNIFILLQQMQPLAERPNLRPSIPVSIPFYQ